MDEEKIQPEIKDFINNLHRYLTVNKDKAMFVANLWGYKEGVCPECNEESEAVFNPEASRMFIYGHKEYLREMLNQLRDIIEDEADEDGFVNI